MDLIVVKTKELQEQLTNHSIAFYTSGQLFLEEYYALALVGKAGLHTLHMYVTPITHCLLIFKAIAIASRRRVSHDKT